MSEHPATARRIRVAKDNRHLEYTDGAPFFYLGDTAWELFHRLSPAEATRYLENRAEKGFTVIQAVVLAELGGLDVPSADGLVPLENADPTKPNEAYFAHVDAVVRKAAELDLFVGMLPTWGKYWKTDADGRTGIFTTDSAESYGATLGRRYRDAPVIWILGGDANVDTDKEREVIDAMAQGLSEGDGGAHLKTYHPCGPGMSSQVFHESEWLDFNMIQSSHGASDHDNGLFVDIDYARKPVKPTIDGEPRYENINVGFYVKGADRRVRFDAYDARQAAYWALLAGACGHTYGNNNIWQMWRPGHEPAIGASIPWWDAMDHPGAYQMGLLRRLFESRSFELLEPYQEMILDGPSTGGAKIRAARARDGSFAFIYSPRGAQFCVDQRAIEGKRVRKSWFDPRYGTTEAFHTGDAVSPQTFVPPTSGRGNDWLLIMEAE
jgi:hypothetical protein